jgi:hypothetical protein
LTDPESDDFGFAGLELTDLESTDFGLLALGLADSVLNREWDSLIAGSAVSECVMFASVPAARPSLRATAFSKGSCESGFGVIEPPWFPTQRIFRLLRTKSRRKGRDFLNSAEHPVAKRAQLQVCFTELVAAQTMKVGRNASKVKVSKRSQVKYGLNHS